MTPEQEHTEETENLKVASNPGFPAGDQSNRNIKSRRDDRKAPKLQGSRN